MDFSSQRRFGFTGACWVLVGAPGGGGKGWSRGQGAEMLFPVSEGGSSRGGSPGIQRVLHPMGPALLSPNPSTPVLQLRIHRRILLCRLLTRRLPSLSIHCFPPWHCFPTSPHPWARSVPVTPHRAPAGASHARRRLQEWPFLLLLFPAAARSSRVFPCGSAAGGSSGSCSRT